MNQYNPYQAGLTRRVPRGRDIYGAAQPPSPPSGPSPEQQMAARFQYQKMLVELEEKVRKQRLYDYQQSLVFRQQTYPIGAQVSPRERPEGELARPELYRL